MQHPSTDDLIQWAAHRVGYPRELAPSRSIVVGVLLEPLPTWGTTRKSAHAGIPYPYQSRIPHTLTSTSPLGITQVRWAPDGSLGAGTEPLR